jgi:cell division septation protein DedD
MNDASSSRFSPGLFGNRYVLILFVITISALSFILGFFVGKNGGTFDDKNMLEVRRTEETRYPRSPQEQSEKTASMVAAQDLTSSPNGNPKETTEVAGKNSEEAAKTGSLKKSAGEVSSPDRNASEASLRQREQYSVQVGAFKTFRDASAFKSNFEKKGYTISIEQSKLKNTALYKVRVGPFSTREEAENSLPDLRKIKGVKPFLVKSK